MYKRVCLSWHVGTRDGLTSRLENDNLRNEYSSLFSDVPKDVPFARVALQTDADAINFWMGIAIPPLSQSDVSLLTC